MSYRNQFCQIGVAITLLVTGASGVLAQSAESKPAETKAGPDVWDANRDGVYTCAEWKNYLERMFNLADSNHDGRLDKKEFESLRKAATALADADFGYFDENQDGKITRSEFVEKPSVFILRFDKNGDCKVTQEEIRAAATPATDPRAPTERPRDRFH